jgi:hypothetical protein
MPVDYWKCPVFILYWVVLKKKMDLKVWAEEVSMNKYIVVTEPIEKAIDIINKYGV